MSTHQWQILYEKALTETDVSKLHECVTAAESAMFERSNQLSNGAGHGWDAQLERASLRQAANGLLQIKTERLKWPTFEPNARPE